MRAWRPRSRATSRIGHDGDAEAVQQPGHVEGHAVDLVLDLGGEGQGAREVLHERLDEQPGAPVGEAAVDQEPGALGVPEPGLHADAAGEQRLGQVERAGLVDVHRGEVGEVGPGGDGGEPVGGVGQEPGPGRHADADALADGRLAPRPPPG